MPISIAVDANTRVATFTYSGQVTDNEFTRELNAALRGDHDLLTFDSLVDMLDYEGDVTALAVAALAENINPIQPQTERPIRGAFVTRDAYFGVWMQAMTHQFRNREFRQFATVEQAEAWLTQTSVAHKRRA